MLGGRATLTAEQEGWGGESWAPSSPVVDIVLQPQELQRAQKHEPLQTAMRKNFEGQAMRRELKFQKQVWAKEVRRQQKEHRQVRILKHFDTQNTTALSSCSPSRLSTLPPASQDLTEGGRPKMSSVLSVANQPEPHIIHSSCQQSAFTDILRRPNFRPADAAAASAFAVGTSVREVKEPIPFTVGQLLSLEERLTRDLGQGSRSRCIEGGSHVVEVGHLRGGLSFQGVMCGCALIQGDGLHETAAKAASVCAPAPVVGSGGDDGASPQSGANEPRYQRMWLSKMTRTGLLFTEESRPANSGFSGYGGSSSASTSRRGSASSMDLLNERSRSVSSDGSSVPSPPTGDQAYINKLPIATYPEEARLRQSDSALLW
ncbi:hypothetical protein LTR35_003837 [Friedmanniomyces endolithicus]|nr:hypothetical protein LTR35_003837 [Friedmanniomyces endolithicus]